MKCTKFMSCFCRIFPVSAPLAVTTETGVHYYTVNILTIFIYSKFLDFKNDTKYIIATISFYDCEVTQEVSTVMSLHTIYGNKTRDKSWPTRLAILLDHTLIYNWRASEASETLSGVYKFELVRYVYIYIL